MAKFKAHDKGWLLMPIIPIVVALIGILLLNRDNTPEVVHLQARAMPGYEGRAESWAVEASPHKKWVDYWDRGWPIVLIGFLLLGLGSFIYLLLVRRAGGEMEGSWWALAFFWLGGLAIIFIGYSIMHGGLNYITELSVDEYSRYKDCLDCLFPLKK